jgi:hypothetical protein
MSSGLQLEFPATIGPFTMVSTNRIAIALNAFYRQHQFPKPDPTSSENSMAGLDPGAAGLGYGEIVFCQLSPLHRITLDEETKVAANIPKDASHFAWAYPAVEDGSGRPGASSAEGAFLEFGGYVYFNHNKDAVGANSIRPAAIGTLGLMFSRPQILAQEVVNSLTQQGRLQEVTLDVLACKGATHFAWIRPDEFSQSMFCPDGAFAYMFADGPATFFAVVNKPVFTQDLLAEELDEKDSWVVVRNAVAVPYLENLLIFNKKKTLRQNLDSVDATSNFRVAAEMTGAYVTRDSQSNLEMTYQDWSLSDEAGTIADPWVIHMVNERFSVMA